MEKESFTLNRILENIKKRPAVTSKHRSAGHVISIAGLEKNVGKTTLLNRLLELIHSRKEKAVVLSIGRDGEKRDTLEQTDKPEISLAHGDCFVGNDALSFKQGLMEIIETFSHGNDERRVFLARILQDCTVEVVNPGGNDKVIQIVQYVQSHDIADFILIDGALDRLSHSIPDIAENIFLVTGAQVGRDIETIIGKTVATVRKFEWQTAGEERLAIFQNNPYHWKGTIIVGRNGEETRSKKTLVEDETLCDSIDNGASLYTSGAITDSIAGRLLESGKRFTLIIKDGTRFIAGFRYLERFKRRGISVFLLQNVTIAGIAVNSKGIRRAFKPSTLTEVLKKRLPEKSIFDIMYTE